MADPIKSGDLLAALNDTVINEAFEIARSNRTGILQTVGFGAARTPFEGHKLSWLDMRVDATASVSAGTITDTATTLAVATGDGGKFRAGMTISPSTTDEVLLVTAVAGDNLTVVRGFGGTTAAAITASDVVTIDSVGREENSTAANDGIFQPETVENYFQTMDTAIELSRRALATMQYGNTNDLAFQVSERIRQLTTQMDRALVLGRKATATIAGEEVSYTGGMRYFSDQAGAIKVDHVAAALTLEAIQNLSAEVVARGGMTNTVAVGIAKARELNNLVSANFSSQRLGDWQADTGSVLTLPSDLPLVGDITRIVVDTNLRDDELFIYDSGMISVVPMAAGNAEASGAWQTKDATAPGQDGSRIRVLGDFGMEVRQSKTHMARLHNIG